MEAEKYSVQVFGTAKFKPQELWSFNFAHYWCIAHANTLRCILPHSIHIHSLHCITLHHSAGSHTCIALKYIQQKHMTVLYPLSLSVHVHRLCSCIAKGHDGSLAINVNKWQSIKSTNHNTVAHHKQKYAYTYVFHACTLKDLVLFWKVQWHFIQQLLKY